MKLRINGVETLEITDPERCCGSRKKLNEALLRAIQGQAFTAKDLKSMFGYAPNTALCDTQLAHLVEPVDKNLAGKEPRYASRAEEKSTKWRIK